MMTDDPATPPTSNVVVFPAEPSWLKAFINDIGVLLNLNKSQASVLYALARRIGSDGMIRLDADVRQRVADQCGIQADSLKRVLALLKKRGILETTAGNMLKPNPQYFTHDWQALKQGRKTPEIITVYRVEGNPSLEVVARDLENHVDQ